MAKLPQGVPTTDHIHTDIRLEVLANEMIDAGIDLDQVLVSPEGGFYRGFRKDITSVDVYNDTLGNTLFYRIKTSRDGIYDAVPENLFHDNIDDVTKGITIDPQENIQVNKKEEEAARKLFQVLEKEFYRLRIKFEGEERKSIMGYKQFYQHQLFLELWPELVQLDAIYLPALMQVLPLAIKYHGQAQNGIYFTNTNPMEVLLKYLLRVDVLVTLITQHAERREVLVDSSLGSYLLGIDSILGHCFVDYCPMYEVKIGPLTPEQLEWFMPNQKAAKVLEIFLDYYTPIEAKINVKFVMGETQKTINLKPDKELNHFSARLGVSSFL